MIEELFNKLMEAQKKAGCPENLNPRFFLWRLSGADGSTDEKCEGYKYIIWIDKKIEEWKKQQGITGDILRSTANMEFELWLFDNYKEEPNVQ